MNATYIRQAGETAPELSVVDPADGRQWGLLELTGDQPILVYWAKSGCPTCQLALPFVGRMASRLERGRLVCVLQDDPEDVPAIRERFGLGDLAVFCEAPPFESADRYGITHVPTWFVVDAQGGIQESGMMFVQEDLQRTFSILGGEGQLLTDEEKASLPPMRPG